MASVITLDELTTLLASQPTRSRVSKQSATRVQNLRMVADGDANAMLVGDERKQDGSPYTLNAILSAYKRLIKDTRVDVTVRRVLIPATGEYDVALYRPENSVFEAIAA